MSNLKVAFALIVSLALPVGAFVVLAEYYAPSNHRVEVAPTKCSELADWLQDDVRGQGGCE